MTSRHESNNQAPLPSPVRNSVFHGAGSPRYPKRGLIAAVLFGVFALIGFTDAIYLTAKHYAGGTIPCAIFTGCDTVTTSAYSLIFGIPVALLGAFYYLAVLALVGVYLEHPSVVRLRRAAFITPLGFIASAYFTLLQFFVLHAFCFYCLLSAGFSTVLFIIGMVVLVLRHRIHGEDVVK